MGTDACILAIGTFGDDVLDLLDYSQEFYDDTRPGAVVTRTFFICESSRQSEELASAFGFEPWDFNSHHIHLLQDVDWESLSELQEHSSWDEDMIREFKELFNTNRFFFLYMPNG